MSSNLSCVGSAGCVEIGSSCLTLVDLAGSERMTRCPAARLRQPEGATDTKTRKIRCAESVVINKSLFFLNLCFGYLVKQGERRRGELGVASQSAGSGFADVPIPYRYSKLTRILARSLHGDAAIVLLLTLNPACTATQLSLHAIEFAQRASFLRERQRRKGEASEKHFLERQQELLRELRKAAESLEIAQWPAASSGSNEELQEAAQLQQELQSKFELLSAILNKRTLGRHIVEAQFCQPTSSIESPYVNKIRRQCDKGNFAPYQALERCTAETHAKPISTPAVESLQNCPSLQLPHSLDTPQDRTVDCPARPASNRLPHSGRACPSQFPQKRVMRMTESLSSQITSYTPISSRPSEESSYVLQSAAPCGNTECTYPQNQEDHRHCCLSRRCNADCSPSQKTPHACSENTAEGRIPIVHMTAASAVVPTNEIRATTSKPQHAKYPHEYPSTVETIIQGDAATQRRPSKQRGHSVCVPQEPSYFYCINGIQTPNTPVLWCQHRIMPFQVNLSDPQLWQQFRHPAWRSQWQRSTQRVLLRQLEMQQLALQQISRQRYVPSCVQQASQTFHGGAQTLWFSPLHICSPRAPLTAVEELFSGQRGNVLPTLKASMSEMPKIGVPQQLYQQQ